MAIDVGAERLRGETGKWRPAFPQYLQVQPAARVRYSQLEREMCMFIQEARTHGLLGEHLAKILRMDLTARNWGGDGTRVCVEVQKQRIQQIARPRHWDTS